MTSATNPYAPPAARVDDVPASSEAEAIRRAHISHEASIKAVALLYFLGGVGVTLAGVAMMVGKADTLWGLGLVAVGVAQFFAGYGVRALAPWGRILGAILSGIGLLQIPVGTLINGYILYLYFSKKGRTVFSPEYKDVIAATPHVKYRTSVVVWIFLALLIGLAAVAIVVPMFR